jgi:SAM-dependent methyltransferase
MNDLTGTLHQAATDVGPDFVRIKARQQEVWSSGNYAAIGTLLQIVGEELCEALDVRSGQKVLDVAAGNGNASLAAARRWCDVVATDYVPALLKNARERAAADRLQIDFRHADAEALPFPDASFDVVMSTFGAMFTANQDLAAAEMMRVCRPGGRIGMAKLDTRRLHRPSVQDDRPAPAAARRPQVAVAVGHSRPPRADVRSARFFDRDAETEFRLPFPLARSLDGSFPDQLWADAEDIRRT